MNKKPLKKEDFEKDNSLIAEFGSYDNYVNSFSVEKNESNITNNDYTMEDVVSVEETGKLPEEKPTEKPKSAYDTYMEEAKNIYNKGVEQNNQIAQNQSAIANAQHREVNRNINELNKASGRANTGYAGDTSIEAYNSYRNAVNEAQSNANASNNDLYSYYLSEMTRMQQAKDTQEAIDREYADNKETKVVSEVENMLLDPSAFNINGKISSGTAEEVYDYVSRIYGNHIPEGVMAYLEKQNGFSEWLDAYNSSSDTYASNDDVVYAPSTALSQDEEDNANPSGVEEGDDFTIVYEGNKYQMETKTPELNSQEYNYINSNLGEQLGAILYFNGKLYVRTDNGSVKEAIGTNKNKGTGAKDLIKAINNKRAK